MGWFWAAAAQSGPRDRGLRDSHRGEGRVMRSLLLGLLLAASARSAVLNPEEFRHYVEALNRSDPEGVTGFIPNAEAWQWMKSNVPFLSVPDRELELTYYYRWWAYRKHIE